MVDSYKSREGLRIDTKFLDHPFMYILPRKVTGNGVERNIESQFAQSNNELKKNFFFKTKSEFPAPRPFFLFGSNSKPSIFKVSGFLSARIN